MGKGTPLAKTVRMKGARRSLRRGATYQDLRGAPGEFHVHLDGKAEVVSRDPIDIELWLHAEATADASFALSLEHDTSGRKKLEPPAASDSGDDE